MSDGRLAQALQNLLGQLGPLNPAETVVVGIGNVLKGDDGAGPKVCGVLNDKVTAEVIDAGTAPENYIGKIVQLAPKKMLIIDAIDFGELPGTVKLFNENDLEKFTLSTHLFIQTVTSEIETKVFFIGIQPMHLELGQDLSKQVADAVSTLTEGIKSALDGSS
jgi:hydrogenase 3 maturation protease